MKSVIKNHGLWSQTIWIQILALLLTSVGHQASYLSSLGLNVVIFKNEYNNNIYLLGYYKNNVRKHM